MKAAGRITTVCCLVLAAFLMAASLAAADKPVNIEFDKKAKRIDLVTGRELPNYTKAERGSIRFHRGRLDTPEDFVTYFHDGIRRAKIERITLMEKVQPQFSIWRIRFVGGSKNTPRFHDFAVSFIPLDSKTNETARRVYVLMNDLKKIDWGTDK